MKPGRIFGGFQILDELGRGAMGVVFKARQLSMDRDVALKFLPKRLAQDERVVARFLREARAAGQLSHPNIVGVHDVGVIDGQYYIAMECIDGSSVQKRLDEKKVPLSESETLDIGGQVADALKTAHGRGILHRDIKPDNILVDQAGRARLADLGLALVDGGKDAGMLTQDGTTLGTPHYMSPEQCGGNVVDSRSDLYSLGATMFHMASNQTPYEGTTAAAVMVKVISEPPRSLKKLRPLLSPAFIALVEKAMSRDPSKRFQDAKQLAEAIHKCQAHKHATAATPGKRAPKRASYLRLWAYGALSGVAAIVILALMRGPSANKANLAANSPQKPQPSVEQSNADETHTIGARNGAKNADNEPALLQFQKLRKEIESSKLLSQNPNEAASRYRELLKKSPPVSPVVRDRIDDAIKHAEKLQRDLAAKWKNLRNATADKIAKSPADAYKQLFEFSQAYPGSREAAAAAVMLGEIYKGWLKDALAAKHSGNLAAARAHLKDAIAAVQSKEEALALQKELTEIERLTKPAPGEDDNKLFAEISEQAERIAREFDTLTGKRFRFNAASDFCRDALKLFRTESIRTDLEVLANAYSQAEQLMQSIRAAVNDTNQRIAVQWFANFKVAGNLSKWDENGVTFTPEGPGSIGPQLISWKFVTGESLVQLVRDMRANVPMTAATLFELGVLAYASGVESVAAESLRRAENLDEKLKLEAELLLKLMPPETNAGARETAPPQPEKKEVMPETREPDVKKEDAAKKNDAVVELNKLGWETSGKWSHDSKIKTAYRVSNGTLRCDSHDANLQLRYALDDGATISIFVRQEKGTGYGWVADNYNATVWGDRGANSRKPTAAEPVEMREVKSMKGWHSIAISIRDNKFSITYDNNEAKSSYALRMTGDIRIVVTGDALLEAPVIRK